MQQFKYKGYDAYGKKVEGELAAATIEEVERRVAAQSVTIIAIVPAGMSKYKGKSPDANASQPVPRGKKFSDADVATILKDLAVMTETGVPFVEALDAAIETARTPQIAQALKKFRSEIVGGKGLSAAMRMSDNLFPLIVCDMIKIAEEGGRLEKALSSAAMYVDRAAELRRKIMNAMLYPIVLSVIAMGTIVVLVTFVAPKFADIFKKMGAKVPASTQLMLSVGTYIKTHPLPVIGGLIGAFFLLRMFFRMPAVNKACMALLLKVPVLGELLRRLALSRAFQSIATLLSSNVSVLAALDHGSKVAGNPIISEALTTARNSVEHGAPLSDSLRDTHVFPPVLVRMVAVGEKTGRLPMLMANTAAHMEEEVDGRLKALISIVEPCMIVVMGCIVGAITMSIIIPMYSVVQNVK